MPKIKKVQVDRLEQINDVPAYQAGNYLKIGTDNKPTFYNLSDESFTTSQITDFTSSVNSNANVQKGVIAYGWGNHALAGYIKTESDPVFSASPAALITGLNITNWNAALQPNSISGTLTIPKLTSNGTNGSITFTNGLITAFINPT